MFGSLSRIVEQGVHGHHALVDSGLLTGALGDSTHIKMDAVIAQQVSAIADFLERTVDLEERKDLIESAPTDARKAFMRLYVDYLFEVLRRSEPSIH